MKKNTLYSAVTELINSYKLGETYTSESFKDALEDITRSHRQHLKHNGQWYRVRTYQTYLRRAGILTNVRRGVWRVNYHVPSWMTLYALETIMGYKNYMPKENRDENGRWLGTEYVMRDPAFQNEMKDRLKTYKQRIDKDGVTLESISDESHNSAASVYKTGVKVTLISTRSFFYDRAQYFIDCDGLKVGETYTVDKMTNNGIYPGQWFITTEEGQYHIPYDCFELYVPKSKTEPKQDTKKTTTKTWKVGDVLTASLLNDHPHNFYGYSKKWETKDNPNFIGNRTIEQIADIAGKKAAKISGTSNIWIEIVTIDNAPVVEDRLPGFLTELEALIAKYK